MRSILAGLAGLVVADVALESSVIFLVNDAFVFTHNECSEYIYVSTRASAPINDAHFH